MIHGANTVAYEQVAANDHHTVADREGFMVLYPDFVNQADLHPNSRESTTESLVGSHPARLWDSNDITSRQRDQGDAAAIVRMIEDVAQRRNLDRQRVYVSGMSSGGMMTSLLIALYPDVFAAAGIIASCGFTVAACFATPDLPEEAGVAEGLAQAAVAVMGDHARVVPVIELHGDEDTTVSPAAGAMAVRQWLMAANLVRSGSATGPSPSSPRTTSSGSREGGHAWIVDHYRDADGLPRRRALADPGHGPPLARRHRRPRVGRVDRLARPQRRRGHLGVLRAFHARLHRRRVPGGAAPVGSPRATPGQADGHALGAATPPRRHARPRQAVPARRGPGRARDPGRPAAAPADGPRRTTRSTVLLADVLERFAHRHRDLDAVLERSYAVVRAAARRAGPAQRAAAPR